MKISEMISNLSIIKDKYGDLNLIYSSDEEGNRLDELRHGPFVGSFVDFEFIEERFFDDYKDYLGGEEKDLVVNSCCIN